MGNTPEDKEILIRRDIGEERIFINCFNRKVGIGSRGDDLDEEARTSEEMSAAVVGEKAANCATGRGRSGSVFCLAASRSARVLVILEMKNLLNRSTSSVSES